MHARQHHRVVRRVADHVPTTLPFGLARPPYVVSNSNIRVGAIRDAISFQRRRAMSKVRHGPRPVLQPHVRQQRPGRDEVAVRLGVPHRPSVVVCPGLRTRTFRAVRLGNTLRFFNDRTGPGECAFDRPGGDVVAVEYAAGR